MTIQTDNFSAPQRVISAAHGSPKEEMRNNNLLFCTTTSNLTLTQKTQCF
jgi:hypothetical protein